jgi:hypothetical protein
LPVDDAHTSSRTTSAISIYVARAVSLNAILFREVRRLALTLRVLPRSTLKNSMEHLRPTFRINEVSESRMTRRLPLSFMLEIALDVTMARCGKLLGSAL